MILFLWRETWRIFSFFFFFSFEKNSFFQYYINVNPLGGIQIPYLLYTKRFQLLNQPELTRLGWHYFVLKKEQFL